MEQQSGKKSRRYEQLYRTSWESLPEFTGWLCGIEGDRTHAYCICCDAKLFAHKRGLRDHGKSQKHLRKVETLGVQTTLNPTGLTTRTIKSENVSTPEVKMKSKKEMTQDAKDKRKTQISILIGQYLRKGYKMLVSSCPTCKCLLMQDLEGSNYCVACQEVDKAHVEEGLLINAEDFETSEMYHEVNSSNLEENEAPNSPSKKKFVLKICSQTNHSDNIPLKMLHSPLSDADCPVVISIQGIGVADHVKQTVVALRNKLAWASSQLTKTTDMLECQQIASTISATSDALASIKKLIH